METINSIEELNTLSPKEKFHRVFRGQVYHYIFCSKHPMSDRLSVAISSGNYETAVTFNHSAFREDSVFLKGEYNSKVVGNIMNAQLENIINSVKKIYLDEKLEIN